MTRSTALTPWLPWFLCFLTFLKGLQLLFQEIRPQGRLLRSSRERFELEKVRHAFLDFEETLESGVIPSQIKWKALGDLPAPWGPLIHESLKELRSRGAPLLPTLKRLRTLAQNHSDALLDAQAKSSQALAQAGICGLLVPLLGSVLFFLLPGLSDHPWSWLGLCLLALAASGTGALWVMAMSLAARWGGLRPEHRPWALAAQCAGERFLAMVRSGNPPDLAWTRSMELLQAEAPELALGWGFSIFESIKETRATGTTLILLQAGTTIRRAIQASLMEGRPCTEHVESSLRALRQELKAAVDRDLALLATRALKPLFACVAPSLFGLLAGGIWMTWSTLTGNL